MARLSRGERIDCLVAAFLVVQGQLEVWLTHPPGPTWLVASTTLLVSLSVAVRRRHPVVVVAVVSCVTLLFFLTTGPTNTLASGVSYFCALYALAVWTDTRGFLIGCGFVFGADALSALHPHPDFHTTVFWTVVSAIAILIVRRAVRDRQLLADALAARTELLEREREARAHEAVAQERARIARELHDLVAHNVSVMVVQAGAERHALGDGQASTRDALASIEQAGRQALAEARRLLGVLRRNGDAGELEPQPGIDHIDVLVEQVQRAGLPVQVRVEGEPVALPAGIDLCAYRIVQESLTNALKHAGPARAEVVIRYAPQALDVDIRDDGRGLGSVNGDGAGHGLIGMRERVALYGGRLETGPCDGGGFGVHVHLPVA